MNVVNSSELLLCVEKMSMEHLRRAHAITVISYQTLKHMLNSSIPSVVANFESTSTCKSLW